MPSKEEASESCGLVGKAKDRALMLKKLGDIEGQVCSSEIASPGIALAHHGMVIGKGGAGIKYIHEKYDVRVRVPKDRESPITVSGKWFNVQRAIKELEELVQQDLLKQRLFLPVNILPEDLGVARGKGGCHAAKIQAEFGVRLRTKSHEHPDSPLLEVEGPLSAAAKAVASIESHDPERRRLNDEHAERS